MLTFVVLVCCLIFDVHAFFECCIPAGIHNTADFIARNRLGGQYILCQLSAGIEELICGNNAIDQAPTFGSVCVEIVAGKAQLFSPIDTDQSWQTLR